MEQRSEDGGRKEKKNPWVSGHLTPTLTQSLKDIMSSQGYPVCAVSSGFRAIPVIYTQGCFHWGLLSCWHFVCNFLFISNQNKHLKLYGKKNLFFICEGNELSLYLTGEIMKEKTLVIRAKSHSLDSSICWTHLLICFFWHFGLPWITAVPRSTLIYLKTSDSIIFIF